MSDTNVLGTILGIGLTGALLFAFPLMTIADRNDDIAQQAVQKKTVEFVDKEINTGAITQSDLDEYKEELSALGHTFNIELEVKVMDDNVGKKSEWTTSSVVGENVYYSVYTDTIEQQVYGSSGKFPMREGYILSSTATNTDVTIGQSLRSVFYAISGKGTYQLVGSHSGVCKNNGSH